MKLRVLHIGNIANNAYNVAKALRQRADIEADAFTHGYCHCISQPEWEDADVAAVRFADDVPPDWRRVDLKGFRRPDWYAERLDSPARRRLRKMAAKDLLRVVEDRLIEGDEPRRLADLLRSGQWQRVPAARLRDLHAGLAAGLPRTPTGRDWRRRLATRFEQLMDPAAFAPPRPRELERQVAGAADLAAMFRRYDIIQTYGVWEPMWPLLLTPSIPRVTFEHGSMREHPFQGDLLGRLLALSYKTSQRNIITNADAIHAIRRLGLDNCTFIPHPVDDEKFRPLESPLRGQLLREQGCRHLIFAPARHNWALKGNDKYLRGFALAKARLGPVARLLLADWGQEMDRSRELVRELDLDGDVIWLPPLPKRRLAEYLNAADVVLDQFVLGCFGTTTPEAMACGRPVLLYYKPEDHDWCFPEHPPVVNAGTAEEIAAGIERLLARPREAAELGARSREWFLRHHSLDVVVRRHVEIYRAIAESPSVVSVPKEYAVNDDVKTPVVRRRAVAVVRCVDPLSGSKKPRCLREVCGVPVIRILAERLAKVPQIRRVVLLLDRFEPETAAAARRLKWGVLVRRKRRWEDLRTLRWLAACRRVALFDLRHPFVDPETVRALLDEAEHHDVSVLRITEGTAFAPAAIVTRNFLIKTALFRLLVRGHADWRRAAAALMPFCACQEERVGPDGLARMLESPEIGESVVRALGGPEFTLDRLEQQLEAPQGRQQLSLQLRDELHREMLRSDEPAHLNEQLNHLECESGCDELMSFPTFVGLNMTSVCNARCVFCSYQPSLMKQRDFIGLEDLKKMDWLKYVKDFAVWGGIGDSLTNPEFLAGYRYLKATFPHLAINLSTNGIRMSRELADEFAGHLVRYNVSLNAARRETWERLMRSRGFDNVCQTYAYLAERRRQLGATAPRLVLSMVLVPENLEESVEFVELAKRLGADEVTFAHFLSSTLVGARDLPETGSLYHHKQKTDEWLQRAQRRAADLGLQVSRPLPFAAPGAKIQYGARVAHDPPPCHDPWKTCYLTVDEEGQRQMIFCCSGFYYGVHYEKDQLTEENFRTIWNHPAARYFRRTVNKPGANAICTYCQSVDRFDPANNPQYYQIGRQVEKMFQSLGKKAA